MGGMLNLSSG
jgi:hypothetical protein